MFPALEALPKVQVLSSFGAELRCNSLVPSTSQHWWAKNSFREKNQSDLGHSGISRPLYVFILCNKYIIMYKYAYFLQRERDWEIYNVLSIWSSKVSFPFIIDVQTARCVGPGLCTSQEIPGLNQSLTPEEAAKLRPLGSAGTCRGNMAICLSAYLPICLSVYLSICLSSYLSI